MVEPSRLSVEMEPIEELFLHFVSNECKEPFLSLLFFAYL